MLGRGPKTWRGRSRRDLPGAGAVSVTSVIGGTSPVPGRLRLDLGGARDRTSLKSPVLTAVTLATIPLATESLAIL